MTDEEKERRKKVAEAKFKAHEENMMKLDAADNGEARKRKERLHLMSSMHIYLVNHPAKDCMNCFDATMHATQDWRSNNSMQIIFQNN